MKKGWEKRRLHTLTSKIGSGATPLGGEAAYKTVGIPLIRSLNVYDDGFRTKDLAYIDDNQAAKLENVIVETGDVLLNITGASVARCCIAPKDFLPARVNQHVSIIRPVKESLLPEFLHYLLISRDYKNRLLAVGEDGGSTRQAITKAQLLEFEIEFPPLSEQQRIVGLLDEAFASLATAQAHAAQNLQNARALFESCIQVEFGKDVALGELVDIKTGKLDANAAEEDGEYPFFTCSRETYAINNYAFDCEAVLLAGNNAVGDFNVKHYVGKFNAYQRTYVITINSRKRAISRYLYYQLQKNLAKFKSQSVGTGTKFLKLGMIKDMMIPLPTIPEQSRIVNQFDALAAETQRLAQIYEQKLAALAALKKSLLHQAFSGEL
jgi:type I restriction enzyme S subunit